MLATMERAMTDVIAASEADGHSTRPSATQSAFALADVGGQLRGMARDHVEWPSGGVLRHVRRSFEDFAMDDPAEAEVLRVHSEGVHVTHMRSVGVVCLVFAVSNPVGVNAVHIAAALAAGNHVLIALNGSEGGEEREVYRALGSMSDGHLGIASSVPSSQTPAGHDHRFVAVMGDLVEVDHESSRAVASSSGDGVSRAVLVELYSRSYSYRIGVLRVAAGPDV